jgi:hypothetical protein
MTIAGKKDRRFEGPLATAAQIAIEKRALAIFHAPEIVAVRAGLAEELRADPAAARPDGLATLEGSLDQWTMALILWELNGDVARPELLLSVDDSPRAWFGHVMTGAAAAGDNPDHIYRNAFLDGAYTYELEGRMPPNGPIQLALEIYRGSPGSTAMTAQTSATPDLGNQISLITTDTMEIDANGRFTVTIGREPGPVSANHMRLEAGAMTLAARDMLADWAQEPTTLAIRRVAGPEAGAPITDIEATRRVVADLPAFVRFWSGFKTHWLGGLGINAITGPKPRAGGWGYLAAGRFDLGEDEALVIETADGGAPYTGIQLNNLWMVMHAEASAGMVSINRAQAARNPDGSLTYVVARRDPGVANWIDSQGLREGIVILRWQAVPEGADPATMLTGTRLTTLAALDDVLKPGVPRIDAEERRAQVAQRGTDYERRLGRQIG